MWKYSNELPLCNIGGAAGKGQADTHNQPSALPGHCDGYLPTLHEERVTRHGKSYTLYREPQYLHTPQGHMTMYYTFMYSASKGPWSQMD